MEQDIAENFVQAPRQSYAAVLYRCIRIPFSIPLLIPYLFSNERPKISSDCDRWVELLGLSRKSNLLNLLELMAEYHEFRTLYYYRLWQGNLLGAGISLLLKPIYKGGDCLYLRTPEIGPGLFVQHGYATSVGAFRIGKNCTVNQLVVIGWRDRTRGPILGDNVSVKAGAKVLGPITVGDNVTIGANAVVTKNVPPNCVVAGVPARIIRRNGIRVDEPL